MKAPRSSDDPSAAPRFRRALQAVWFRAALALLCLAGHLAAVGASNAIRFHGHFNTAPGQAPAFAHPRDAEAQHWNRLAVSRWDSGNYISIALRRYSLCPDSSLRGADLRALGPTCNFSFYPTYPLLGWVASLGARIPIDYALWGLSLAASLVFLFLWTGPVLVDRIGLGPTYVSFAVFNLFTTGFLLVAVQTEPLALLLTLGAFLALARRWVLLGAVLAGAATAIRITAVATGMAYAIALVALTIWERPRELPAWLRRGAEIILSGWGVLTLLVYYGLRFGDPFLYLHAHAQSFHHEVSLLQLVLPEPERILTSIEHPLHEGVWLAAALLWFALGHRQTLDRFPRVERVFLYALFILSIGVAAYGSIGLAFAGMNRYLLLCLPLFLVIAVVAARKPLLLALWLTFSVWHYWNSDLCEYSGGPGDRTLRQCCQDHWIGRI
jgi:hypothetical protein